MIATVPGVILGLLVFVAWSPAAAQSPAPPMAPHEDAHPHEGHPHHEMGPRQGMARTREAGVGNPAIGKRLFRGKGCVKCHAIKGEGGDVGPDLGRIEHSHNIYQMAGIMWNHATQMAEVMQEKGIERPEFRPGEMAHLLAYLHSLEVVGDPEKGRGVFEQKGCNRCHSVEGEGGRIGPPLAPSPHPHPPIDLAGMMWNHSPAMTAMMKAMGIPRPRFEGNEITDLLAYLDAARRRAAAAAPAGAPHHAPHHAH